MCQNKYSGVVRSGLLWIYPLRSRKFWELSKREKEDSADSGYTFFVLQILNVEKLKSIHLSHVNASAWFCWGKKEWEKEEENAVVSTFISMAKTRPSYNTNASRLQLRSVSPLVSPPQKFSCNQAYRTTNSQIEGICGDCHLIRALKRMRHRVEAFKRNDTLLLNVEYPQNNGHVVSSTPEKGVE